MVKNAFMNNELQKSDTSRIQAIKLIKKIKLFKLQGSSNQVFSD